MSIIAVKSIPQRWSLRYVVKVLANTIKGHFEALNFQNQKIKGFKICYLQLSEKLDPVQVVERINSFSSKLHNLVAYIPKHVPDIPLASKLKQMPLKKKRKPLGLAEENPPDKVLSVTHTEIMTELQSKYPGLHSLSKKNGHKLLEEIAKIVLERVQTITDRNPETSGSCFKLSQAYRRAHPHFGDFQLVLSCLHQIEDAAGSTRTQLEEKELAAMPKHSYVIDNLPFDKVQAACNKYSERIIKRIAEHVNNLKSEFTGTDTEDDIARKKVREELKKMTPFLPQIMKQVVSKHFVPQKTPFHRVRIYGEPFLPSKDTMSPFMRRYEPDQVVRSHRMFNMLQFNVPPAHFASLLAMDGTVLNGAKLVIRSSDMPIYKVSAATLAGNSEAGPPPEAEMDQEEDWGQWDEAM